MPNLKQFILVVVLAAAMAPMAANARRSVDPTPQNGKHAVMVSMEQSGSRFSAGRPGERSLLQGNGGSNIAAEYALVNGRASDAAKN